MNAQAHRCHPMDVYVGGRIRLRRMLLGMSQSTLGEGLGLTFQQIQKYEKGANRVSCSRLYEISKLLEVPIMFFFEGFVEEALIAPMDSGDKEMTDILATRDGFRLVQGYTRIQDQQLKANLVALVSHLGQKQSQDD